MIIYVLVDYFIWRWISFKLIGYFAIFIGDLSWSLVGLRAVSSRSYAFARCLAGAFISFRASDAITVVIAC